MPTRLLPAFAVLLLSALPGFADEPPSKSEALWSYEGYARLPEAAADAKKNKRRLLLGLSGSPT